MKNWKTSFAGIGALGTGVSMVVEMFKTKDFSEIKISQAVLAFSTAWGLLFAKDHNVTGGSKQQ